MDDYQVVNVPGVGKVRFPSSMSDDAVLAAVQKLHIATIPLKTSGEDGPATPPAGPKPIDSNEPYTWMGGFGSSLKKSILDSTVGNSALQGAAHPQTLGDILSLALPSGAPNVPAAEMADRSWQAIKAASKETNGVGRLATLPFRAVGKFNEALPSNQAALVNKVIGESATANPALPKGITIMPPKPDVIDEMMKTSRPRQGVVVPNPPPKPGVMDGIVMERPAGKGLPAGNPPVVTPPPADTSYVRGVDARPDVNVVNRPTVQPRQLGAGTPPTPQEPLSPRDGELLNQLLGPGKPPIITPPPADASFVRGVDATPDIQTPQLGTNPSSLGESAPMPPPIENVSGGSAPLDTASPQAAGARPPQFPVSDLVQPSKSSAGAGPDGLTDADRLAAGINPAMRITKVPETTAERVNQARGVRRENYIKGAEEESVRQSSMARDPQEPASTTEEQLQAILQLMRGKS